VLDVREGVVVKPEECKPGVRVKLGGNDPEFPPEFGVIIEPSEEDLANFKRWGPEKGYTPNRNVLVEFIGEYEGDAAWFDPSEVDPE
jgi:hypothetical protein